MKAIEENWNLSTVQNGYSAIPDTSAQEAALASINGLRFRAMSIGGPNGQVAIIPLDESSEERGLLASKAPQMARILLSYVTSDKQKREEAQTLLRELRLLP